MALVITLILLSVTLIMAVAFLAMSRRERGAVTTATDTVTARLAADSALAAVQAHIIANALVNNTGLYEYHLLSSTNFLPGGTNQDQFSIGNILPRPTVWMTNLTLHSNERRFYLDLNRNGKDDPSGWVAELDTNGVPTGKKVFEVGDPEWIGVLERPDLNPGPNNRFLARYAFFAQPAGNALDLNYIHNQTLNPTLKGDDGFFRNQGVGSWELNLAGFLADLNTNQWGQVIGNSDNEIYNYYYYQYPSGGNRGYAFNDAQALLAYRYNNDSNSLLKANQIFINSPYNAVNIFPYDNIDIYSDGPLQTSAANINESLGSHNADGDWHSDTKPWAGSASTNRFFALPSELFDPSKSWAGFTNRLVNAGKGASTYDSYTFYRLLDQISTDSTADDPRMNLNYDNLDTYGVVIPGAETNLVAWTPLRFFTNAANRLLTNYTASWLAANTNLYLATYNANVAFGVTNIPVLVSNKFVYTPAVHRLLQLAANIFDASTNYFYPSVFRPTFRVIDQGGVINVFINGFVQVTGVNGPTDPQLFPPANVTDLVASPATIITNVYGVPWIIGAKKGFPAFNQFSMRNDATITRKLQLSKASLTTPPDKFTNSQMYVFSINHSLGWSFWNSYSNQYPNPVTMVVRDNFYEVLTNSSTPYSVSPPLSPPNLVQVAKQIEIANVINSWPGMTNWQSLTPPLALINTNAVKELELTNISSFAVATTNFYLWPTTPLYTNSAVYRFPGYYNPINWQQQFFDTNGLYWQITDKNGLTTPPLPQFGLVATNQLQVFLLDGTHVIDYVHMILPMTNCDLTAMSTAIDRSPDPDEGLGGLTDSDSTWSQAGQKVNIWSTNANTANYNGYPAPSQPMASGIFNQVMVSLGVATPSGYGQFSWVSPPNLPNDLPPTSEAEKEFFKGFFEWNRAHPGLYVYKGRPYTNHQLTVQAPFTAVRTVYNYSHWQANDPLVHYLASDLYCATNLASLRFTNDIFVGKTQPELSAFIQRFSPWGLEAALAFNTNKFLDHNGYNLQYKDPGVWRPDFWDFPSGKFPSPGWLGRIHRGTPWQTVYLKCSNVIDTNIPGSWNGTNTWAQWTGDTQSVSNYDAINSLPLSDHALIDLFTTKINDNASRGNLPINVGSGTNWDRGLAAWSALFSGVVALTNSTPVSYVTISPAGAGGASSPVGLMVSDINYVRANMTNNDGVVGTFERISDILRVPRLTEQSPFLNPQDTNSLSDVLYEWVPQQVLGLLRLASLPRYMVYCYGQALRPAPNSVFLGGGANFGLVTNYQVVAESAARAVIRVDKTVNTNAFGVITGTNFSTTIESYTVLPPD